MHASASGHSKATFANIRYNSDCNSVFDCIYWSYVYFLLTLLDSCVSRFLFYEGKDIPRPTSAFVWAYGLVEYEVESKSSLIKVLHHRYMISMRIQSFEENLQILKSKMIAMTPSTLQKVLQTVSLMCNNCIYFAEMTV